MWLKELPSSLSKVISLGDVAYLLRPIMPLESLYALARIHGRFVYAVRRKERVTVRDNMLRTFRRTKSLHEIDSMTRRFFEYRQLRILLLYVFPGLNREQKEQLFPMEGLEHLDWALSQKKGVILLGSHLNSLCTFVATWMLRERGYNVRTALPTETAPYAPTVLRRMVNRLNGQGTVGEGIGAFYAQFNIRPIVRCLENNEVVVQTGDGWHSAGFIEAEFLGRLLPFTTGMMRIAQITESVVVPLFTVGTPPDKMRFIIEQPFRVEKDEGTHAHLRNRVAGYVKRLEHHLLENIPCWEHWLIDNTLEAMAAWPQRSLEGRYEV